MRQLFSQVSELYPVDKCVEDWGQNRPKVPIFDCSRSEYKPAKSYHIVMKPPNLPEGHIKLRINYSSVHRTLAYICCLNCHAWCMSSDMMDGPG